MLGFNIRRRSRNSYSYTRTAEYSTACDCERHGHVTHARRLAQVRISSRAPTNFTGHILQPVRQISLKFHEISHISASPLPSRVAAGPRAESCSERRVSPPRIPPPQPHAPHLPGSASSSSLSERASLPIVPQRDLAQFTRGPGRWDGPDGDRFLRS